MAILPAGRVGAQAVRAGPARPASTGFSVPGEVAALPRGLSEASAVAGLSGFLSLQEVEQPTERNQRARRAGQSMLDALARLQRGLLDGEVSAQGLSQLADLARDMPVADDPALREVVEAISVRVHVELARHAVALARFAT